MNNPNRELPPRWRWVKLGEVCEISAGGDVPKSNYSRFKTGKYSIPIYSNGVGDDGIYGYTNIIKVNKPCITVSARGTIGYAVLRDKPFYPVIRLIILIPNKDIELRYLKYAIDNLSISSTGSSIPQLTVPLISKYKIPLPPLTEQKRIAATLERAQQECQKLEGLYRRKLECVEELWQAVLRRGVGQGV